MIELPIIGSLLEAAGTILEKKVLRSKGLDSKNYTTYEFLAIILAMAPFVWLFWNIDSRALTVQNLLIFAFVIIIAVFANLLIFYSLKRENVTEFEPIWLMQYLFVVLLAFAFYPSERNPTLFLLAMAANIALILAHVRKHHLVFDKYILAAFFGSFLFSVELVVSNLILQYYNPFVFYFIRCSFIFLICFIAFRPNGKDLSRKNAWIIFAIGAMWAVYRTIIYYGYQHLGVVITSLLFLLSPVFVFLFAVLYLKEKPDWRQIASTIVIVICVAAAILFKAKYIL